MPNLTQEELDAWPTATLKDCRVSFTDFHGRPMLYNPEGRRSFGVFVTSEDAELLRERGVRIREYDDDEGEGIKSVVVAIGHGGRNPSLPSSEPFDLEVYLTQWVYQDRAGTKLYFKKFL